MHSGLSLAHKAHVVNFRQGEEIMLLVQSNKNVESDTYETTEHFRKPFEVPTSGSLWRDKAQRADVVSTPYPSYGKHNQSLLNFLEFEGYLDTPPRHH